VTWVTGLLVYVILWWMVLFITLPFGVRPQENPEPGTVPSAPEKPRLWLKLGVTTVGSGLLWMLFRVALELELVSFRPPPS
jgi:predicted secreted protein